MRIAIRNQAVALWACAGMALACSGEYHRLKGEEMQPGVFKVLKTTGQMAAPGSPDHWDSIGVMRLSDFRHHVEAAIENHSLVFIARVDSVIGMGSNPGMVPQDTVVSGLVPDFTLVLPPGPPLRFYARLVIDTLLKGQLPSKAIWIQGGATQTSCGVYPLITKSAMRFLNFSNGLDSMSHLKVHMDPGFCANCPASHWFDGQYLRSPYFSVLSLDIREVLSGYPVSLRRYTPVPTIPFRAPGRAYRTDGRREFTDGSIRRKVASPVLRQRQRDSRGD